MNPKTTIKTLAAILTMALSQSIHAKSDSIPGVTEQPDSYFYTGKPYDADLGAYVFAYRSYSPSINQWTLADPTGFPDGVNNRLYANNRVTYALDPLGLLIVGIYGAGGNTVGNYDLGQIGSQTGGTMYDRDQKSEIKDAIRAARRNNAKEPVILFGYSRGGIAANDVAKQLNSEGICVDLLVLIDPVRILGDPSLTIPGNVEGGSDYYQTNGGPFKGTPVTNPSASFANHDLTSSGVDHNSIVGAVSQTVISEINAANHQREHACE